MKSLKDFDKCKKLYGNIKFDEKIEAVEMKMKELEYNATGIVTAVNTNLRTLSFLKIVKQNGKEQNVKHCKLHQTRGDMKKDFMKILSQIRIWVNLWQYDTI